MRTAIWTLACTLAVLPKGHCGRSQVVGNDQLGSCVIAPPGAPRADASPTVPMEKTPETTAPLESPSVYCPV